MPRPTYHLDPERDACGIGFVADAQARRSHAIVATALAALGRVEHRGAIHDDPQAGDGAGVMLPIDASFFAARMELGPEDAELLGVAMAFLPADTEGGEPVQAAARRALEDACLHEGIGVAGWRVVPVDPSALGEHARMHAPRIEQAILLRSTSVEVEEAERRAFRARKRFARTVSGRGDPGVPRIDRLPHGHLQGAVRGGAARPLLRRPHRRGADRAVRRLPPALLDQHDADVEPRAAVPLPLPQRRDQHHPGQRQLDGRARGLARHRRPHRRGAGPPGHRAGRLGQRDARQRGRAARPRRPRHPARDGDAGARGVGGRRQPSGRCP